MKIPATDLSQGEYKCYLSVMNAKSVFEHSIVSRAAEDPVRGYQRHLDEKRAKDIAQYLDSGNVIPGCVILSAQTSSNIKFEDGYLTFDNTNDAFFVIDGQHRLYGSHMATTDVNLPVYIFKDLELTEEIQLFLDVNSKQKGVPKTLRIALTKFLTDPDSNEAIRLALFEKLNTDPDSALFNRLTSTTSVPGKISQVPFQSAISPILEVNLMKVLDFEKKYLLLKNLTRAAEDVLIEALGDSKKLTTTVFFISLFKNFELICEYTLMLGSYKYENFKTVLQPLEYLDFDIAGTGTAANKQMTDQMAVLIETHFSRQSNADDLF